MRSRATFLIAALLLAGCASGDRIDNVLVIVVDTLRADRLGCYGNRLTETPVVDRMAREGVRFETAVCQVPVTAPSMATLLTGTYPTLHGVRDNGRFVLSEALPTLAQAFRNAGFRTGAFVSAGVLERKYGFARGFETYDDDLSTPFRFHNPQYKPREAIHQNVERRAEETTARANAWLEDHVREHGDQPFFLLVHYFDPHDPYDPPQRFLRPPMESPYDAEIAYADESLGQLLQTLVWEGLDKETLVVFTADHGEGGGEHGEVTHGFFVYDSTLRVPLIFRGPGLTVPGTVIDLQARLVDLAPTLLDLCGLDPGPSWQGRSLAPALTGEGTLEPEPSYVENYRLVFTYDWHELVGIRTEEWKYIRAPKPELYDLKNDPGETSNEIAEQAEIANRLSRRLDHLLERIAPESPLASDLALDEETRRKLAALGYLSSDETAGAPAGGASTGDGSVVRPDPKDMMEGYLNRQRAKDLLNYANAVLEQGNVTEAKSAIDRAISLSPRLPIAHFNLGLFYRHLDSLELAEKAFLTAVELDPLFDRGWVGLGYMAFFRGDDEAARGHFETAYRKNPNVANRDNLFHFFVRTGRWEEALDFTEELRRSDPGDERYLYTKAYIYGLAGRWEDEYALLRQELGGDDPSALFRLLELRIWELAPAAFERMEEGKFGEAIPALESALVENPNDQALRLGLARALVEEGRAFDRARQILESLKSEDPILEGHRLIVEGKLLLLEGDKWEAERTLIFAATKLESVYESFLTTLRFYQGQTASVIGNREEAVAYFSRVLNGSFGKYWEEEARAGGGKRLMERRARG